MEIHTAGLPAGTDDIALITLLAPLLHHPPIALKFLPASKMNFSVSVFSFRKRFKQQVISANILIADKETGMRFLRYYEGRNASGLSLKGSPVSFNLSSKAVSPQAIQKVQSEPFIEPAILRADRQRLADLRDPISFSALQFGKLCDDDVFSPEYPTTPAAGQIIFDSADRMLRIRLVPMSESMQVSVRFTSIERIQIVGLSILLTLEHPPIFELVDQGKRPPATHVGSRSLVEMLEDVLQSDDFRKSASIRKASLDDAHARVAPFTSMSLRLLFSSRKDLDEFIYRRGDLRLPSVSKSRITVQFREIFSASLFAEITTRNAQLDRKIAFQLDRLLYNCTHDAKEIVRTILPLIEKLAKVSSEKAEATLMECITGAITTKAETHFDAAAEGDWDEEENILSGQAMREKLGLGDGEVDKELSNEILRCARIVDGVSKSAMADIALCQHINITPTGLFLQSFRDGEDNSILRRYADEGQFLRVSICEEDVTMIRNNATQTTKSLLLERYRPLLVNGLLVAGRRYEFLGWSQSALREHSVWFVCRWIDRDGSSVSASSILAGLGNFDRVGNIPARWMARVAQSLTTTRPGIDVENCIVSIPDVEKRTEGVLSTFTDGVGTISPSLARKVEEKLRSDSRRRSRNRPASSADQIRCGGYKGMVSIAAGAEGEGDVLSLRPSMSKFDSSHQHTLDIASTFNRPLPCYLNRPLIKILEDLGIPAQHFVDLQRTASARIEEAKKTFLGAATLLDSSGLGGPAKVATLFRRIKKATGIELHSYGEARGAGGASGGGDEFLEAAVELAVINELRNLKFKGRIFLPLSYVLVGVADEAHYLKEGEVYAAVKRSGKATVYLEGLISISRSPCVHPGDLQVVRAVGKLPPGVAPRLSALVNCVAFSMKGDRSLPSFLGGGDLDGDIYSLIVEEQLLPPRTHEPAPYTESKKKMIDRPCVIEDGIDFFLEYILSDLMGVVANRHLVLADFYDEGTLHRDCLTLAALHSDAVDYPKTGMPVDFKSLPKPPALKPDFMAPEGRRLDPELYYESTKALGRLYRDIPLEDVAEPRKRSKRGEKDYHAVLDEGDVLMRRMRKLIKEAGIEVDSLEDGEQVGEEYMEERMSHFGSDLLQIARYNTLSQRSHRHLTEEEVFVGSVAAIGDPRRKKEAMVRLKSQSQFAFNQLRYDIEDPAGAETLERAWRGFVIAKRADQSLFGVKSFGWTCMGLVLRELLREEDEEED